MITEMDCYFLYLSCIIVGPGPVRMLQLNAEGLYILYLFSNIVEHIIMRFLSNRGWWDTVGQWKIRLDKRCAPS